MKFEVIYHDEDYLAIHKPPGIHVHPTRLSPRSEATILPLLQDQMQQDLFTVHRLDRATSGVLLFAKHNDAARKMSLLFAERKIEKRYLAVVRGYIDEGGRVDHALKESPGKEPAEAQSDYRRLATVELPIPVGQFATARYSLVEVRPLTGRKQQIRRHMAHLSHPIIGDTGEGDGRHNRLFRTHFNMHRLLLMAIELRFVHPFTGKQTRIYGPPPENVLEMFEKLGWGAARRAAVIR